MQYVDVHHEELMRGSLAGGKRPTGTGTILDAIKGLHPARRSSTADCPAMPRSLSDRYKEKQLEREEKRKAKKK